MNFNQTHFTTSADRLAGCPEDSLAESAVSGRSNAGKSSAINAITGQKALARTSNTPGRTQELNFFLLAPGLETRGLEGAAWLVDLPGYGYARESKNKIAAWNRLLEQYLSGRPSLRRVFVLIDSRHGLKANDLSMMDNFDSCKGDIFNLGTGEEMSVLEHAKIIKKIIGSDSNIIFISEEDAHGNYKDIRRRKPSLSKSKRVLDYVPKYDFKSALEKVTINEI